ncbi:MAG: energy transducer TonB [Hyphomicrobiales bacterium]|nr:energy transducer TonB [Hyphomicrobiales bacterium]
MSQGAVYASLKTFSGTGWAVAAAFAIALHGSLTLLLLQEPDRPARFVEDEGIPFVVELAPLPVSSQGEGPGEQRSAAPESQAAPPTPELEEKLSARSENNQPQVDATAYDTPPDSLSRKKTEKKDEEKKDEAQATDAAKATPAQAAPSSAAADAGGTLSAEEEQAAAAKKAGSVMEAHDAPKSWQRSLMAHLGKNKRYPRLARRRKMQGDVVVEFIVDRNGRVVSSKVQKSSGHPLLDREVMDMLSRAQPLPKLPVQISAAQVHIVLPIRYRLK